jgi:hypothetical protein
MTGVFFVRFTSIKDFEEGLLTTRADLRRELKNNPVKGEHSGDVATLGCQSCETFTVHHVADPLSQ